MSLFARDCHHEVLPRTLPGPGGAGQTSLRCLGAGGRHTSHPSQLQQQGRLPRLHHGAGRQGELGADSCKIYIYINNVGRSTCLGVCLCNVTPTSHREPSRHLFNRLFIYFNLLINFFGLSWTIMMKRNETVLISTSDLG